jgi:hypothetical protein
MIKRPSIPNFSSYLPTKVCTVCNMYLLTSMPSSPVYPTRYHHLSGSSTFPARSGDLATEGLGLPLGLLHYLFSFDFLFFSFGFERAQHPGN